MNVASAVFGIPPRTVERRTKQVANLLFGNAGPLYMPIHFVYQQLNFDPLFLFVLTKWLQHQACNPKLEQIIN